MKFGPWPCIALLLVSLVLIPAGLLYSEARTDPPRLEDNIAKFDTGFYDKISNMMSGASGASSESTYYSLILVTDDKRDLINDLKDEYDYENILNPEHLHNVIVVHVALDEIHLLADNNNVKKIGDGFLPLEPATNYNANNPDHISIKKAKEYHGLTDQIEQTGMGITIGLVDTNNSPRHKDLVNGSDILERVSCTIGCHGILFDFTDNTHFNHVASIITGTGKNNSDMTGIAPDSKIRLATGEKRENMIAALNHLVGQRVDLIATVVGTSEGGCTTVYTLPRHTIALVIDGIVERGTPVISAMGNFERSDRLFDMACAYNGIGVANIQFNGTLHPSSSRGGIGDVDYIKPDIAAIGTNIAGAARDTSYDVQTGTSFAAPIVASAAALMLEKDGSLTPNEIRTALLVGADFGHSQKSTAKLYESTNTALKNYINGYGFGALNIADSLALINDNKFPNIISDAIRHPNTEKKYRIHAESGDKVKILMSWNVSTIERDGQYYFSSGNTPLESLKNYNIKVTGPMNFEITSDSTRQNKEFAFFMADHAGIYEITVSAIHDVPGDVWYALGSTHPIDKYPYNDEFLGTPPSAPPNTAPIISLSPASGTASSGDTVRITATTSDADDDDVDIMWLNQFTDIAISPTVSDDKTVLSFVVPHHPAITSATIMIGALATDGRGGESNLAQATVTTTISPEDRTTMKYIFNDNFEADLSKWTAAGTWWIGPFAEMKNPPEHTIYNYVAQINDCKSCTLTQASAVNLQNHDDEVLQFYRYLDSSLGSGEHMILEVWNGRDWIELDRWDAEPGRDPSADDDEWHLEKYTLADYTNVADFKIRFTAQSDDTHRDIGIDDVQILEMPQSNPPDTTPPVISNVPADMHRSSSSASLIVTYTLPTVNEGSISCTPASGSTFLRGTTVVTCIAVDDAGNTSTAAFDVTVSRSIVPSPPPDSPPVIDDIADITMTHEQRRTVSVTATDPERHTITLSLVSPPDFVTLSGDTITIDPASTDTGTHTVTVKATANFKSDREEFTVTVTSGGGDTTDPTITAPSNKTFEATARNTPTSDVSLGNAVASDDSGVPPTVSNNAPATYPLGRTIVTWTATDGSGNTATDTQTVTVQDTTPPEFSGVPENTTVQTTSSTVVTFTLPTATDIVDGSTTVYSSHASGSTFEIGDTTVTFTATDKSGNTGTASFTVTVIQSTHNVPSAPHGLAVYYDYVTTSTVPLAWHPSKNNGGCAVTDYTIQYKKTPGTWSTFNDGISTSTYNNTVTGLEPNTSYQFRVASVNCTGSSNYSNTVSATTKSCPANYLVINNMCSPGYVTYSGYVFRDSDEDGIRDSGEGGVPGKTVIAISGGWDNSVYVHNQTLKSTTTSSSGYYILRDIPTGSDYFVVQVVHESTKDYTTPWHVAIHNDPNDGNFTFNVGLR